MTTISLKKIFHDGDFANSYDAALLFILSLLILFLWDCSSMVSLCLIMCLVQEMCII